MIILNSKRFSFGGGILLFAMVWLFYTRRLRIGTLTNANEICVSVLKGSFKETRNTAVFEQKFIPQKIIKSKLERFDYKAEMKTLIDRGVRSDDPALVDLIRNFYIQQPSDHPYNLAHPTRLDNSCGQAPVIDSRLNFIEGGFYIECGALDGETLSNSLFFERVRKWNGLLIEADPSNYQSLKSKNRKAFSVNACLSPKPVPSLLTFNKAFQRGRVVDDYTARLWIKQQNIKPDTLKVECFPFYSFMLALNRTTIDFFSLDVEGEELNVLQTIPFDKLTIKMLAVEYAHQPGGWRQLQKFMEKKGYETLLRMHRDDGGVDDLIFIKKGLNFQNIL